MSSVRLSQGKVSLLREQTVSLPPVGKQRLRLAVLVSGSGSTLQNIIESIAEGALLAEIVLVVSSRRDAFALKRAQKHGLPSTLLRPRDFIDAAEFDTALCQILVGLQPDLVVLAGYLAILGPKTLSAFRGRIMNIHPSLLPAFGGHGWYGRHVHSAVIAYGAKVSGATVMYVEEEIDLGPIILQEAVPVYDFDTVESLAARVAEVEKRLYPEAIRLHSEGRLSLEGRRVKRLEEGQDEKSFN